MGSSKTSNGGRRPPRTRGLGLVPRNDAGPDQSGARRASAFMIADATILSTIVGWFELPAP
jgi:hypothetical protein